MRLIRHQYGPEGYAYVRSYLKSNEGFGGRLGTLLGRRNIEAGIVWALVPAGSALADRLDFEQGAPFLGQGSHGCPKAQLDEWVRSVLAARSVTPVFCMEDALARRTDGGLERLLTQMEAFFCGERVYWFATAASSPTAALLRWGATWDPNIAMVATLPADQKDIHHRGSISGELLERMAAAALFVIIGAWDADGFVVWEPPKEGKSPVDQNGFPLALDPRAEATST